MPLYHAHTSSILEGMRRMWLVLSHSYKKSMSLRCSSTMLPREEAAEPNREGGWGWRKAGRRGVCLFRSGEGSDED